MDYKEDLLISRPPLSYQRRSPDKYGETSRATSSTPYVRIECQAEERHFTDSSPYRMSSSLKPIDSTINGQIRPGLFRSEIIVHNNPNVDMYIKRLRVGFHEPSDPSVNTVKHVRSSSSTSARSHSLKSPSQRQQHEYSNRTGNTKRKIRSASLPRSNSQAILHQWIDDICSNERLLADDDIVFFLKNGEFLARI
jgi:hypothetical protein